MYIDPVLNAAYTAELEKDPVVKALYEKNGNSTTTGTYASWSAEDLLVLGDASAAAWIKVSGHNILGAE